MSWAARGPSWAQSSLGAPAAQNPAAMGSMAIRFGVFFLALAQLVEIIGIEIGLRPGAADLGILGKFAFSKFFLVFFKGFLSKNRFLNQKIDFEVKNKF